MKRAFIFGIIAIILASCLLAPGVWWGDSLNAYIQGKSNVYAAGQPVLMALICTLTAHVMPGSLPIFAICISLYFIGLALMVFGTIRHRIWAPLLFFSIGFYPLLFANIGVIQTEALQLAILGIFIPLTILLYRYKGRKRLLHFALLVAVLCIFYDARYDSILVVFILAYWLVYSYLRTHSRRTLYIIGGILFLCYTSGGILDKIAGLPPNGNSEMKASLLVTDIAAISAESGIDYVPEYCWKPILKADEKNVRKIAYGLVNWKSSFYSYIYNIDPSVGLFTYDISRFRSDITFRWIKVICRHPLLYLRYHLLVFGYLMDGDNYDMGLWSGLRLSHLTNARLVIDRTPAVEKFLEKHGDKYSYLDGNLIYVKDDVPISSQEENDLRSLVDARRYSDVTWMQWYSRIPSRTYTVTNPLAEGYVLPLMDQFKIYFGWLSRLGVYFLLLVILLLFFRRSIRDPYYRLTFTMLCVAGILHLALRLVIITDPVFRFGIISVLFLFCALVILIADRLSSDPDYWPARSIIILALIELSYIVFLISYKLRFLLLVFDRIVRAEQLIFENTVAYSRFFFPHAYRIHTISLYILALCGAWVIIRRMIIPAARWLIMSLSVLVRKNKRRALKIILVAILPVVVGTVFLIRECELRSFSYCPGSCYPGNDFSEDTPAISWELIADERGMNYFNYDSFAGRKDPAQLIINHQGFPSAFDFDRHTIDSLSGSGPKRKWKQLFLGDSFLEGVGSSSHDKSFIEIYRRNNPDKLVCSTGIGGMDPVQYSLVSDKYMPIVMPDEVVVMFCGWNDILGYDRKPVPYLPVLTDIHNVGVIYNYIPAGMTPVDTLTLTPDRAYRLYRKRFSLMEETGFWPRLCRKSCVTTQLYYKLNPVQYYPIHTATDSLVSYRHLKSIKDLADSLGIKFTIVFIPTPAMKDYSRMDYESHFRWAFRDLWPYVHTCPPGTVTERDCSTPIDFHLNDSGQEKFAAYLQKELSR